MGRNGVVAPAPGDCHVAVAPRNDGARRRAKSPNPFLCVIARSPEVARGDSVDRPWRPTRRGEVHSVASGHIPTEILFS